MNKVSIIIPIYNACKYIEKCVESFLKGTYQDIEIILINDGSTDNSLEVIKKLEKKYPNKIKVYTQKNCGVAKTRNKGITYATGKYIMFSDNDDYVDDDYVERLVKEIKKGDYDYIVSSFKRVDEKGKILYQKKYKNFPWTYYMFVTPWAKIFKKQFLIENDIKYMDVPIGEDIYFTMNANWKSKKKKIIPYAGYNWLYNETSISNTVHKKHNSNNIDKLEKLFKELLKSYDKNKENISIKEIRYFLLKTLIWYILYSTKNSDVNRLYLDFKRLKLICDENLSDIYQGVSLFKPKGESIKVRLIIKLVVIFDKIKLLKPILKIYSKI